MFVLGDEAATLTALAVIACAYVVFGMSGFGASLITVPVLSHFYPLSFVVALASLLDLAAAISLGVHGRRDAAMHELRWLIPFSLAGAVLGVTLLVTLPRVEANTSRPSGAKEGSKLCISSPLVGTVSPASSTAGAAIVASSAQAAPSTTYTPNGSFSVLRVSRS